MLNNINWKIERQKVSELKNWDKNPRTITKEAMDKLKKQIQEHGFHSVIVIDQDQTVLSGNQRKHALEELQIDEVDVIFPDRPLTDEERNKIAMQSNISNGEWDMEKLKSFELDLLLDVGFDQIELSKFWDEDNEVKEDDFPIEKELKKITKPKTKLGDIICLGSHRLLCGDSTNPENLRRLLGDEKASMIYSDPVYNLNINYDGGIGGENHMEET